MAYELNLTKEQRAILDDVSKKASPKNIIIKSLLKDISESRNENALLIRFIHGNMGSWAVGAAQERVAAQKAGKEVK